MVLIHRRFVIVGIGGNAAFHLEKVVGIPVYIGFGSSGETHQNPIEIFKNRPVFLENAAVAFVNDNQVKVGGGKELPSIL